ncbi:MAG: neutral zinc metallopeptidase, partial [Actinobacteria bacterium]|nr:neutral zinc metallopeptidase [Actinomycetota bacterium]
MDFRKGAKLDPTQVEDRRGMRGMRGGRGVAVGGGAGIVGIIVVLLITVLGGGNIDLSALESLDGVTAGGQQQQGEVIEECKTGEDAEKSRDCRLIGTVNSIQAYWTGALNGYRPAVTVFFSDSTSTGCG